MTKRILILGVAIIMVFGLFACEGNKLPHNAVMYGDIYQNRTWLQDEFYENNLTYGSYSSVIEDYVKDETYPLSRSKIIADKAEFDMVFKEFPVEVDFEKDMIVMYCFTTVSGGFYEIKEINLSDQTLTIKYKHPKSKGITPPNASIPLTKWIIVTMEKLDIETVEFIFDI